LDRDGKVVALKTHHYAEVTWSVITSEGGLLVAGTMNSPVLLGAWTETAALVLKLDPNLETVWETRLRIDGSMNGQDGFETAEGDCLAAGTYGFDLMTGHDRPWLAKLDREGKLNDPEYKKAQVRGVPHLVSNSLLEAMIFSIFMFQGFLVP
jgi:hypothetical protein